MPRILFVDDYPDALEVWSLYLKMAGFDVLTANDGPAALELARNEPLDIAILDLDMPVMSGDELARRLRADGSTRHLPLIAVTGHSQTERIDEARRAGFNRILTKPCDPEVLCAEIRRLLSPEAAARDVADDAVIRHDDSHRR